MGALLAKLIKMSSSSMATHGVVSFSTVICDDHCTSFTSISHGGDGNNCLNFFYDEWVSMRLKFREKEMDTH